MSLDPRLAAHAASFWGWSDDDSNDEQVTPTSSSAAARDSDDSNSETADSDDDTHPPSALISHNHTIDDMRSDDDDDDEGDNQDDDGMSDDGEQDLDPGFTVKRTVSASVLAANRRPAAPQVVVFDDPMANGKSAASYGEFKSFMSSKVSKVTAQPPPAPVMTDAERQEELELSRQDRELDDLLKTSKLIEQVAAEELTGRDRRKYQMYKLEELGMQKVQSKMPLPEFLHISDRDKKREARALQFATQAGLDVGSVKRGMTTATALARNVMDKKASSFDKVISFSEFGKKKEGKKGGGMRERGLKATNLGKFKGGMLVLSKQDIRKVQGGGVGKKKGGAGGGGGGGGGGSKGGASGGKGKGKGKRK